VNEQKTVLVTGAGGFLGRYVCREFSAHGWRIIGLDLVAEENVTVSDLSVYYQVDLPHDRFTQILKRERPVLCIHCAGRASVPLSMREPITDFRENTILVIEILEALRLSAPNCVFLQMSSAAVYGNPPVKPVPESCLADPVSPYGFHKLQAELICREYASLHGVRTASVRIFSAYGAGLRRQVLWDLSNKIVRTGALKLQGTGNESRDFVHARDIARAVRLIYEKSPLAGEVYNLGSGHETSIRFLAEILLETFGLDRPIEFSGQLPSGTPVKWQADITKLAKLGFQTQISFAEGVREYVDWCKPLVVLP